MLWGRPALGGRSLAAARCLCCTLGQGSHAERPTPTLPAETEMRPTCAHSADVGFSGRTHAFTVHLPAWQPAGRRRGRRLHRAAARAEAAEPSGEAAAGLRQPQAAARAAAQPALAQPQPQRDPYTLAGQRLRSLLNGVGDGEVRRGAAARRFMAVCLLLCPLPLHARPALPWRRRRC